MDVAKSAFHILWRSIPSWIIWSSLNVFISTRRMAIDSKKLPKVSDFHYTHYWKGIFLVREMMTWKIASERFLHSAQMMSQITPLEVDILFQLCDLLHQTGWVSPILGASHPPWHRSFRKKGHVEKWTKKNVRNFPRWPGQRKAVMNHCTIDMLSLHQQANIVIIQNIMSNIMSLGKGRMKN